MAKDALVSRCDALTKLAECADLNEMLAEQFGQLAVGIGELPASRLARGIALERARAHRVAALHERALLAAYREM